MSDFFAAMTGTQLVFWLSAIIGTSIFLILFLLGLVGMDTDTDADVDMEIDMDGGIGLQFFTFKNVMAFFTLFGWTGISCLNNGFSNGASLFFGVLAGLAMMALLAFLFLWISRLAEDGTHKIENAIDAIGEVYLSVGKNRSKIGKITVDVQGSRRELSALTDEDVTLVQGTVIRVTEVVNGEILLIEKI